MVIQSSISRKRLNQMTTLVILGLLLAFLYRHYTPLGRGHAYNVLTGEPMVGAWIIIQYRGDTYDTFVPGSHMSQGHCRRGRVVRTGDEGEFTVPRWSFSDATLFTNKREELGGYTRGYQLAYHGDIKHDGLDRSKLSKKWPYKFKKGDNDLFFLPISERFTTEDWLVGLKGIANSFCGSAYSGKSYQMLYKEVYNEAVELLKIIDKDDPSLRWRKYKSGLTRYEYIESAPDDICNYGLGILNNFNKRWPNGCPWPKLPGDDE